MIEAMIIDIFVFFFAACIGSFLNVCIVRLPKEQSVVSPGSHCVACKKPVAWYDNIPLLSYFILGGKCRHCKAKFSVRYFFVELITALSLFGLYKYYGLYPLTAAYWVMFSGFIVATFVDFEHRIIPDEVSIGGMFAGLILSAIIPELHGVVSRQGTFLPNLQALGLSILGLLAGGGSIYLMAVLGDVIIPRSKRRIPKILKEEFVQAFQEQKLSAETIQGLWDNMIKSGYMTAGGETSEDFWKIKRAGDLRLEPEYAHLKRTLYQTVRMDTMGGGDVKLMAMVGAFLGWKLAILTFFVAPFFGAIFGLLQMLRTRDNTLPYGPFLVLGAIISQFYGNEIIRWILSGYGL